MTKRCLCVAVVFLLVAFVATGFSQTTATSVRGLITDPSGAVVPNAKIVLTDNASGRKLEATSSGSGEYVLGHIPPATYSIVVTATGFASQTKTAELLVNQPATIDFVVSVEASQVVVNVSAEAQTLNLSDATIGNSVNNAVIQSLPMEGRNVPDLLSLQPGVLYLGRAVDTDSDSRTGAVAGARSDQTNVTLDGVDDNDQNNGYAFTGVLRATLDSTEEFRVTTTNANADAGRSSGAQVTLVTKSGTDQFHGALYAYNRNTFTVANDWFNKAAQIGAGLPNVPGKLIRNTFGGSLGGPIKKDKLFFFFNYEGQRTAENKQITQITPTASFKAG
ncbi:MAG: carboxypeptidase-like regulatory domain-containing protein, partial [Silvibacterium sp.]